MPDLMGVGFWEARGSGMGWEMKKQGVTYRSEWERIGNRLYWLVCAPLLKWKKIPKIVMYYKLKMCGKLKVIGR